ncbi:hypothetical protein As57867_012220, partial [Aphanomyces stellatus]
VTSARVLKCALESNLNIVGNDVGSQPAADARDCCAICRSTLGCGAYTWTNFNGGTCWLKSAKAAVEPYAGAVTGVVGYNPAQCGAAEVNVNYVGNDLRSLPGSTPSQCCALAQTTPGAGAYTWTNFNNGTCWIKSARTQVGNTNGAISAVVTPKCGGLQQNTNILKNDLTTVPAPVAEDCCGLCRGTCKAYTFLPSARGPGTCYLKTAGTPTSIQSGVASAALN